MSSLFICSIAAIARSPRHGPLIGQRHARPVGNVNVVSLLRTQSVVLWCIAVRAASSSSFID